MYDNFTNRKVVVIGAGLMGSGISLACAQAGYSVTNIDNSPNALVKSRELNEKIIGNKVVKGKLTQEAADLILANLNYSNSIEDTSGGDLIIEAVPENIDIKKKVFESLDQLSKPTAVLMSNTSGLSISEIASFTEKPNKVIGVHFFYPPSVMKLIELIRGLTTDDDTYDIARKFAESLGKTVVNAPEYPGFIVNRILVPMQNEAAFMVMEGTSPKDVDTAMKLGCNFPMGPLELTDYVGVDTMLSTMKGLYKGFHDSKYRPCPLLETMVKAGHLGRKSGKGFYEY